MKVLALGPLWRGSNAGGLFRAMSRQGCIIEVIDEFYFISLQSKVKTTKIAERLIRPRQIIEYNNAIIRKIDLFKPDVVFVYKGAFVLPATLDYAKERNCMLALFYPDVSMTAHGPNIPQCIPKYKVIFTTPTVSIRKFIESWSYLPNTKKTFPAMYRLSAPIRQKRKNGCQYLGNPAPE
jgi:spore maturation protein CgeB